MANKTYMRALLLSLITLGQLGGIDYPKSEDVIPLPLMDNGGLIIDGRKVFQYEQDSLKSAFDDVTKKIVFETENSFIQFKLRDRKYILIPGDSFNQAFYLPSKESMSEHYVGNYGVRSNNSVVFKPSDINLKSISTKSFYSESIFGRKIDYKSDWLKRKFYRGCSCHDFNYDELVPPWVEGEADFGSTEEINVTFTRKTDGMTILNGYVDIYRPYLFAQNNRLKQIKIVADKFEILHDFKDEIKFSSIIFPEKTQNIKIQIISVYEGTKYNDTAISAILGYIPKQETKASIIKMMKARMPVKPKPY